MNVYKLLCSAISDVLGVGAHTLQNIEVLLLKVIKYKSIKIKCSPKKKI